MATIKLKKKILYKGVLTTVTGLHIGGTNASLNIGGPDSFVVRNPLNNIPYIPGSSLKGKMRALIEIANGCVSDKGDVSDDAHSKSGALFGVAGNSSEHRPSRLIVRDAELITSQKEMNEFWTEESLTVPKFDNTDLPYTESKTEVTINRLTAKANPRTIERVPAGAQFKLNFVLNIFEDDNEEALKETFSEARDLLKNDYLGGNGSRGYGQVDILLGKEEEKVY